MRCMKTMTAFLLVACFLLSGTQLLAADTQALESEQEKISYALGMSIGKNLKKDVEIDLDAFFQGVEDAHTGDALMTQKELQQIMMVFQKQMQQQKMQKMQAAAAENKAEGKQFLEENQDKEGVVALESGLQYKILQEGDGPSPTASDTVKCDYKGMTIDGQVFDSSYKRGEPATFPLNGVIPGWTEALQLMKVGSKWKLFIPSDLAYGDKGAGQMIEPGSTLIFEVELLDITESSETE